MHIEPMPVLQGNLFQPDALEQILLTCRRDPRALVQVSREVQALQTWLSRAVLAYVARELGLTLAYVEGVATLYRFLHTSPVGEYRVLFSDNITDRVLGSADLMSQLCRLLGVERGRMREDGRVSVDFCFCKGRCDQGPALLVRPPFPAEHRCGKQDIRTPDVVVVARPLHWPVDGGYSRVDVAMSACAINGGLPAERDRFDVAVLLEEVYQHLDGPSVVSAIRNDSELALLLQQVRPIHAVVHVDYCPPGCPPSADAFSSFLNDLMAGRTPHLGHAFLHCD